jgi:hypothetical protein
MDYTDLPQDAQIALGELHRAGRLLTAYDVVAVRKARNWDIQQFDVEEADEGLRFLGAHELAYPDGHFWGLTAKGRAMGEDLFND